MKALCVFYEDARNRATRSCRLSLMLSCSPRVLVVVLSIEVDGCCRHCALVCVFLSVALMTAVPVDLDVPSGGGAPMYVTAEPLVDTPAATQTAAVRWAAAGASTSRVSVGLSHLNVLTVLYEVVKYYHKRNLWRKWKTPSPWRRGRCSLVFFFVHARLKTVKRFFYRRTPRMFCSQNSSPPLEMNSTRSILD